MTIRRERRDAVEHRQLILRTANHLFHEHGVQPVSMHQIAKTAGIGQATLYRRYAHKGDLCLDILDNYGQQLMNQINDYLEHNHSIPAAERLGGIIDSWVDTIEEKSGLISGLIIAMDSKMTCEDERGNFFYSPLYLFFREKIAGLIVEMTSKDAKIRIEPDLAAHAIICALSPAGYFHIKQEKEYTQDQLKLHLRQLCHCISSV